MDFRNNIELDELVYKYLESKSIINMTSVQKQAYKHILNNRDLIICSSTGSGKTLSYVLPLISRLQSNIKNVQYIILLPTKELAVQVNNQFNDIFKASNSRYKSLCLIGDVNISRQIESLKDKPTIIVGTPSRILQLINMKKLKVHEVKTLVLDEADRLSDSSFRNSIEDIRHSLMKYTQIIFCSASIDKKTKDFANTLTHKAIYLDVNANNNESVIPNTIKHIYFISERRERIETLRKIIKAHKPDKAIIFVNSKYDLDESFQKLVYHNYNVGLLSSNQDKFNKKNTLDDFKQGKIQLLIATDIVARGLQIDNIDTVININLPKDNNEYLHRAGRCGRNGNSGVCINIITDNEINKIKSYQKEFNINIVAKKLYQGKIVAK